MAWERVERVKARIPPPCTPHPHTHPYNTSDQNTLPNTLILPRRGETLQYLLSNYFHRLIPLTQSQGKHIGLTASHDRKELSDGKFAGGVVSPACFQQHDSAAQELQIYQLQACVFDLSPVTDGRPWR